MGNTERLRPGRPLPPWASGAGKSRPVAGVSTESISRLILASINVLRFLPTTHFVNNHVPLAVTVPVALPRRLRQARLRLVSCLLILS